jgi:hypothetical protein
MRIENNTVYVERKDADAFFDTLEKSIWKFKQHQLEETDGTILPPWVARVQKHMDEHVFLFIREASTDTGCRQSYKAGYVMGVLRWSQDLILKQMDRLAKITFPKSVNFVSEVSEEEFESRFAQLMFNLMFDGDDADCEEMLKGFLRSIRKMFIHAPISEASEFFEGLADGFKGLDMRGGLYGKGNLSTPIMVTLMFWWPQVEKMQSVSQLHRWLQVMDGKAQVGELKRVEKICERIGLTFRKPGRPKKLKKPNNSDTTPKA